MLACGCSLACSIRHEGESLGRNPPRCPPHSIAGCRVGAITSPLGSKPPRRSRTRTPLSVHRLSVSTSNPSGGTQTGHRLRLRCKDDEVVREVERVDAVAAGSVPAIGTSKATVDDDRADGGGPRLAVGPVDRRHLPIGRWIGWRRCTSIYHALIGGLARAVIGVHRHVDAALHLGDCGHEDVRDVGVRRHGYGLPCIRLPAHHVRAR